MPKVAWQLKRWTLLARRGFRSKRDKWWQMYISTVGPLRKISMYHQPVPRFAALGTNTSGEWWLEAALSFGREASFVMSTHSKWNAKIQQTKGVVCKKYQFIRQKIISWKLNLMKSKSWKVDSDQWLQVESQSRRDTMSHESQWHWPSALNLLQSRCFGLSVFKHPKKWKMRMPEMIIAYNC